MIGIAIGDDIGAGDDDIACGFEFDVACGLQLAGSIGAVLSFVICTMIIGISYCKAGLAIIGQVIDLTFDITYLVDDITQPDVDFLFAVVVTTRFIGTDYLDIAYVGCGLDVTACDDIRTGNGDATGIEVDIAPSGQGAGSSSCTSLTG